MQYRESKIPEATVQRLSIYLRYVTQLHRDGVKVVSSYTLSKGCGFKAAQVRKDFAYFGELGVRGVGYYVKDLYVDLKKILGLVDVWEVALVGAGHLGSALIAYRGFQEYGFVVSAIFDREPENLPEDIRSQHTILPMENLKEVVQGKGIRIAIVAVPAPAAEEVVEALVDAGVQAILNFAPVKLETPQGVKIRNVDLAVDLGVLSFFVTGKK
ncbi:redox-sensing transcriptional repressor Rex [Candidatus Moduliflexota bacterium]